MNSNKASRPDSARKFKNLLKSQLHSIFAVGQKLGFDILPRHFYSEIPDLRILKSTTSWRRPFPMSALSGSDIEEQSAWVGEVVTPEMVQRFSQSSIHDEACSDNGEQGYGPIEAEFLHSFITRFKPKNIIQIGCGVSTAVCLRAAAESSYKPRIMCVEPYPNAFLKRCCDKGLIELIPEKAQDVNPSLMSELKDGDLFFVDSSHTLGPAGEVTRIILDFLPRLNQGVFAHFHDIYFPYDYTDELLDKALFFQHESPLLMAFLTLNAHYRIMASLCMLHHQKQSYLTKLFPRYAPAKFIDGIKASEGDFPSSIFIRRVSS